MKKRARSPIASKNPHFDPARVRRLVRRLTEYYKDQVKKGLLDQIPPHEQIEREAMELAK